MSRGNILFIDNDFDFLEELSGYLTHQGYQVYPATSIGNAEEILRVRWVQLIILDLHLEDDNDPLDDSGKRFAELPKYAGIPKLILTVMDDSQMVRTLLRDGREGSLAIDYVEKKRGREELLRAVERAFAEKIDGNADLSIRWGSRLSPYQLVTDIDGDTGRAFLSDCVQEIEDLLRRQFKNYAHVTIGRILANPSNMILMTLTAYGSGGSAREFLVLIGQAAAISHQQSLHKLHEPSSTVNGMTLQEDKAETWRYASLIYRLVGTTLSDVITLQKSMFLRSDSDASRLVQQLLTQTLAPWHRRDLARANASIEMVVKSADIAEETMIRARAICSRALKLGFVADWSTRQFSCQIQPEREIHFDNPELLLRNLPQKVEHEVVHGVVQGQFDSNTILVNEKDTCWVTDFRWLHRGPVALDYAALELALLQDVFADLGAYQRYQLVKRDEMTEERKVEADPSEPFPAYRARQLIEIVRKQAKQSWKISDRDYDIFLSWLLLRYVQTFDSAIPYSRYEFVPFLLGLCLLLALAERLVTVQPGWSKLPEQARSTIWVEEAERRLWVQGIPILLPQQLFDLACFLYQNADRVCTREELSRKVLNSEFAQEDEQDRLTMDNARINRMISRLRKAIAKAGADNSFLDTRRGGGYLLRLNLPGD